MSSLTFRIERRADCEAEGEVTGGGCGSISATGRWHITASLFSGSLGVG
jgi:hypothetical protein